MLAQQTAATWELAVCSPTFPPAHHATMETPTQTTIPATALAHARAPEVPTLLATKKTATATVGTFVELMLVAPGLPNALEDADHTMQSQFANRSGSAP